jgi:hypothetical protein
MDMLHSFDTFFQALELFSNVACRAMFMFMHDHVEESGCIYSITLKLNAVYFI